MKPIHAPALLVAIALVLMVGAWKLGAGTGSTRDALRGSAAAVNLPTSPPTSADTVLLADQTRLGSDLRSAGAAAAGSSYAVRDTQKLIRDVSASTVGRARKADELRQAADVVRLHPCTECLRLLVAATTRP